MTRDRMIQVLQDEYAARREQNLAAYEQRVAEVCERCTGLEELISRRRAMVMGGIRNAFYADRKDETANAGMTNDLQAINRQINATLAANGLSSDALDPIYRCPICRDEGYVYNPTRRKCECFETELNQRMLSELGIQDDQTFENFDAELFAKDDPAPVSQYAMIQRNRSVCQRYAEAFPDTETSDLLFIGKSGLGKTYLMHAIAHRVTEHGHQVEYCSAFNMLGTMRKSYFENNLALLNSLIHVPLLLIDDLGTEPLMENITVTQLFNLLNERQNRKKHTIISTNLSIPELKARYTERITSRLLDESRCKLLKFIGGDIRPTLKQRDA